MASRRSRGRSRYRRRRAHAVLTKGRPTLVASAHALGLDLQPHQESILAAISKRSTTRREVCPVCGNRERVKKDGTMGLHTASIDGKRQDCPGVGRTP